MSARARLCQEGINRPILVRDDRLAKGIRRPEAPQFRAHVEQVLAGGAIAVKAADHLTGTPSVWK
jgi:hypothetical protein